MASSQVGFPAPCILRDLNQRSLFRDINNHKDFPKKKNHNDFVKQRVGDFVLDENSHENISNIGPKSRGGSKSNGINITLDEKFDETKTAGEIVLSVDQKRVVAGQFLSPKASSLVQIWEERLRRSNSLNNNGPSRGNSGSSLLDNVEEPPRESFSGDSDSMSGWSFKSRNSDVGENERVKVADVVKKLSNVDGENEGLGLFDQVVCLPRIRGRQAFNELLMRMERDRHKELDELAGRHAVSKFKHRKRIQSGLRLRILQRQMADEGHGGTNNSNSPDVKRTSFGSNIMQLRAKFSMGFGRCMTFPGKEVESRRPKLEILRSKQQKNEPSSSSQVNGDMHQPEVHSIEQQRMSPVQHSVSLSAEDIHKEANQSPDVMQATGKKSSNFDSQDSRNSPDFPQPGIKASANFCSRLNENSHYQEVGTSGLDNISPLQHNSLSNTKEDVHEEATLNSNIALGKRPEACNTDSQGLRDNIAAFPWQEQSWNFGNIYSEGTADEMVLDNWDGDEVLEEEYTDEELVETNCDWVNEIARPRSYWEDCRQSRYQEVLGRESNNELRQLLERGTVSSFLSSGLRERIEGLMESRICGKHPAVVQEEEDGEEGVQQFMLSLNRDTHSLTNIDEESNEAGIEVDSEGSPTIQHHFVASEERPEMANPRSRQKREDNEKVNRVAELSPAPMCSHDEVTETDYLDQDQVAHDYSDHSASSNPLRSETHDKETHNSSTMCHSSIDAEVINDLRGKMEQIQKEMLELRKSVKFCMDLQFGMQELYKEGVHSVTRDEKNSQHKRPRKDCCIICYIKHVDSLLYRCGHMCTCLECAHELQCSSEKCPICQAPIDDVVRAYTDSECC